MCQYHDRTVRGADVLEDLYEWIRYRFVDWHFADAEDGLFAEGIASFLFEEVQAFVQHRSKNVSEVAFDTEFVGIHAVIVPASMLKVRVVVLRVLRVQ